MDLLVRYRKFFKGLKKLPSPEVQVAALVAVQDIRSSVGANLALLKEETGLDPWTCSAGQLRGALSQAEKYPVLAADLWRVPYMSQLLKLRQQYSYSGDKEQEQRVQSLLDSLVIN